MHVSWSDIPNFHTLRAYIAQNNTLGVGNRTKVFYRSKVKLHGTNVAVQVRPGGKVFSQGRNTMLSEDNDQYKFDAWVQTQKWPAGNRIIFGEWVGPGVQSGVACSKLPRKVFAVFAVRPIDSDRLIVDPEKLEPFIAGVEGAYVLPWHSECTIDYSLNAEELQPSLDQINQEVLAIEACDPWVKSTFGIEGVGEGLVWYPQDLGDKIDVFESLVWKAKGEKHQTVGRTKPAQATPEKAASLEDFAKLVCTEARLKQGLQTIVKGNEATTKLVGPFLAWITGDIKKECQTEIQSAGLLEKDALNASKEYAKRWYLAQVGLGKSIETPVQPQSLEAMNVTPAQVAPSPDTVIKASVEAEVLSESTTSERSGA